MKWIIYESVNTVTEHYSLCDHHTEETRPEHLHIKMLSILHSKFHILLCKVHPLGLYLPSRALPFESLSRKQTGRRQSTGK